MKTSTLTRADIVDTLVREVDLPRQQASDLLEFVLENMINSLAQKKCVKVSSFGQKTSSKTPHCFPTSKGPPVHDNSG